MGMGFAQNLASSDEPLLLYMTTLTTGSNCMFFSLCMHCFCFSCFSSSFSRNTFHRSMAKSIAMVGPRPWEVGMEAWLPRRNAFLSRFYPVKRGRPIWVNRYEINYGDLLEKNLIPHVPAFKVTQGHCSRTGSVGYLWLTFSDPQQRWAYLVLFQR